MVEMMTCFDFECRLQELSDLRQFDMLEELMAHANHCSTCRELAGAFVLLHRAVAEWRLDASRLNLGNAVMQQEETWTVRSASVSPIDSATARRLGNPVHRHSPFATWTALLTSAIALLVALGLGWRAAGNIAFAKRQGHLERTVAKASNQTVPTVQTVNAGDRQLDVLMHDARDAYVALASQAWQQVSTASLLVPSSDASAPFLDESATQLSEPLSRPLAPLGKELREAVDSWFQQVF